MTFCAGLCVYEGYGGLCSVRLSQPLLKFRPRKDLVETLLHEMIHAYLFVPSSFLDMFTQDGASFNEDKLRVSVVQYSSNVKVLIPLQMGTSADAIKKAAVINDGNNSKSLPSEDVAGAVWKAVFRDPNDHRPFVPKLVVIVAISNSAGPLPDIGTWSNEVQPEVSRLWSQSTARAADVVQIAHIDQLKYKIYVRRSSSNPIQGNEHTSLAAAFNNLGKDALDRLQDVLKTCPYDNDNIPCYYEFKKCLVRVSFDLDKVQYDNRKYCLSAIPCPNGDQGCRTQCEKVSTPTNCIVSKIPKSMDSETVFYHQKCMAFDNYSSAMQPCENSPGARDPTGRHLSSHPINVETSFASAKWTHLSLDGSSSATSSLPQLVWQSGCC